MRQITIESCDALLRRVPYLKSNTEVIVDSTGKAKLYLHGNLIAVNYPEDGIYITNAGWKTSTTKERLNGIGGVFINQKNGKWFLNGEPWNGGWAKVN